ncbi:MAG: Minf_1886 family protein [Gemmataceae bacterium]
MHHPKLEELIRRDPRYAYEAYEFVFAALTHTQEMLGQAQARAGKEEEENHVSGPQLLAGVRDLALREYGLMARTVFRMWGINRTDDFGEIVFNLVEAGLMSKTAEDDRRDFQGVYDLDEALTRDYRIDIPQEVQDD